MHDRYDERTVHGRRLGVPRVRTRERDRHELLGRGDRMGRDWELDFGDDARRTIDGEVHFIEAGERFTSEGQAEYVCYVPRQVQFDREAAAELAQFIRDECALEQGAAAAWAWRLQVGLMLRAWVDGEYPCARLPQERRCDRDGPGGFMGHTCVPRSVVPRGASPSAFVATMLERKVW